VSGAERAGGRVGEAVIFARNELRRFIAGETSSFRAGLFERELESLEANARQLAERPSRFARVRLAVVLETVARYTLDSVESWPEEEAIISLDGGKTCARLARVFDVARRLRQG
jgi:hypothetical protein